MRLYQVQETVPGTSMTLLDMVEGGAVVVTERTASRTTARHECLAARVIPRGCTGGPEMDMGVLPISAFIHDQLSAAVKKYRGEFLSANPRASIDAFYKLTPPFFHDAWITSIFEPAVPKLANTDGEELVVTRVSFDVDDKDALARAFAAGEHAGDRARGRCQVELVGQERSGQEFLGYAQLAR